jgi:hypothetical protein
MGERPSLADTSHIATLYPTPRTAGAQRGRDAHGGGVSEQENMMAAGDQRYWKLKRFVERTQRVHNERTTMIEEVAERFGKRTEPVLRRYFWYSAFVAKAAMESLQGDPEEALFEKFALWFIHAEENLQIAEFEEDGEMRWGVVNEDVMTEAEDRLDAMYALMQRIHEEFRSMPTPGAEA